MIVAQKSFLADAFARYQETERETVECLGEKNAHLFVDIWNDYFEFENAIAQVCPQDKRIESLVAVRLWEFSRELNSLQVLFLCGNYSLLRSRLRFILEMILRAFYADTYEKKFPNDPDGPGSSIDHKSAWLEKLEKRPSWGNVIKPTVCKALPLAEKESGIVDHYEKIWKQLNAYVHPSHCLVETMIDHDGLLIERFDEEWARETIAIARDVFDLVWLAVIARFPSCAKVVASGSLLVHYPVTEGVLKKVLNE